MGRFFTSFDEAWEFFLTRETPLEDFFARFPLDEQCALGWLLPLEPTLRPAANDLQGSFAQLDWVTPFRETFFHVWLSDVPLAGHRPTATEIAFAVERAEEAWAGVEPFDLRYARINCFHDGVVVEVEGDGPRRLVRQLVEAGSSRVPLDTFLPHLTLGVFNTPHEPAPLRQVLVPRAETALGEQRVSEAILCVVPASRTTILDPWEVVGSVVFG
jgi:hypothetical protein